MKKLDLATLEVGQIYIEYSLNGPFFYLFLGRNFVVHHGWRYEFLTDDGRSNWTSHEIELFLRALETNSRVFVDDV